MGNILYRDEGVGVYAARYLQKAFRFTPEVDVEDGAALGFGVIDYFEDGSRVILLDALQTAAPPGTMFRIPREELLHLRPSMRPTAHEVDPVQHLKLAAALGKHVDLTLLGIVPADVSEYGVGLTEPLRASFPRFVALTVSELENLDVRAERIEQPTLDEVIHGLVSHG